VDKLDNHARTARACLESLGLQAHPEVWNYIQENGSIGWFMPHPVAVDVVYREDATTQFQNLPPYADQTPPGAPLANALSIP